MIFLQSILKQLEATNQLATKIYIIADDGKAHTENEAQLFLEPALGSLIVSRKSMITIEF